MSPWSSLMDLSSHPLFIILHSTGKRRPTNFVLIGFFSQYNYAFILVHRIKPQVIIFERDRSIL